MKTSHRTNTCGELTEKEIGKKVTLCGWVDVRRDHGKLIFLDLRDRYGITQIVVNAKNKEVFETANKIRKEFVIKVKGEVKERPKGTENKELKTGQIEIGIEELEILNESENLPFELEDENVNEEVRLKYRFLDLRRKNMQRNLETRYKIINAIRDYLTNEMFIEIETPILSKSTPEGARDYLVPSRVNKGKFYALPQSPQTLKQICMVAGLDRYYQIARCFRDEDLRADRQPEFTQLDLEMSFVDEEDIFKIIEGVMKNVWKEVLNVDLKIPFPRMNHKEAMDKYNSDKPDLRAKKEEWKFLWVTDFPLFEYNQEEKKWDSSHHPFTSPKDDNFDKDPKDALSKAYDLVLNGTELGSGSIRINRPEVQKRVFRVLGLKDEEIEKKFGFLINAFKFGAPIHGGIALGIDRICALAVGSDSIREVLAFPKNKEAKDLMLDAPSDVSEKQLKEVSVKVEIEKKKKK